MTIPWHSLPRMKKRRGQKRYYKNLKHSFNPDILSYTGENAWFDFYPIHMDHTGIGNKSWKSRRQHLEALFSIAQEVQERLKAMERPFQFWLEIFESDSFHDAIYIHTENPNKSEFPFKIASDESLQSSN